MLSFYCVYYIIYLILFNKYNINTIHNNFSSNKIKSNIFFGKEKEKDTTHKKICTVD